MLLFYILYYYTKILHSIFIIYIININVIILLGTFINCFIYMFFFFKFDFLICYKLKEVGSKSNIFSLLYIFCFFLFST